MLDLHVGLIRLVHDVLALLVHHLRLAVLGVHHGHLASVADLWGVARLRTDSIRAIRRRSVVLLMWGRSLALDGLVVHRDAHVSLVFRSMRRGM